MRVRVSMSLGGMKGRIFSGWKPSVSKLVTSAATSESWCVCSAISYALAVSLAVATAAVENAEVRFARGEREHPVMNNNSPRAATADFWVRGAIRPSQVERACWLRATAGPFVLDITNISGKAQETMRETGNKQEGGLQLLVRQGVTGKPH